MKSQIEQALEILVGEPLILSDRALDMDMFHFGERHTIMTKKGYEREVGKFRLHVQCAWRITGPKGIVVASRDRYYPGTEVDRPPDTFDWNEPGNRCDTRLEKFILEYGGDDSLAVLSVEADDFGTLKLRLAKGFVIDVFPDDSFPDEHWRFFQNDTDQRHFVVTGEGIQK